VDEHQRFLFAAATVQTHPEVPPAASPAAGAKAPPRGHGRQRLPPHLRRQVRHELPPEQQQCPHRQAWLRRIGEETSERLEYVPATFHVIEEVCGKYACPQGCTVVTAAKPMQPIEKGLPGPGLLPQVAVSKYGDHLPLHRQAELFRKEPPGIPGPAAASLRSAGPSGAALGPAPEPDGQLAPPPSPRSPTRGRRGHTRKGGKTRP
jgi:transposase